MKWTSDGLKFLEDPRIVLTNQEIKEDPKTLPEGGGFDTKKSK